MADDLFGATAPLNDLDPDYLAPTTTTTTTNSTVPEDFPPATTTTTTTTTTDSANDQMKARRISCYHLI